MKVLKARAEANEYMYYKMLENGMAGGLDESIGTGFLRMEQLAD